MTESAFGLIISKLAVKNFATFDDQTISLTTGFNAIVGETGSGKSLILDALQLILGNRADRKLIRKDCDFSIVEATFKCQDSIIQNYFFELGYPFEEDEIVIKRILYKNGKTKSFLNHQSCSLTTLSEFSKRFIDLVGQFENQKLLSPNYQLQLLDNFCLNQVILKEYTDQYNTLQEYKSKLEELENHSKELNQKKDYLDFQLNEFAVLSPSIEREQELLNKKRVLQNLEENKSVIEEFNHLYDGSDTHLGISTLFNRLESIISEKLLSEEDINSFILAKEALTNISYKVNSSLDIDFDESEFENVLEELDLYQKIKRKYAVETDELTTLHENLLNERKELENIDDQILNLKIKIEDINRQAFKLATELHKRRVEQSKELSNLLTKEIQNLRMVGATINIELGKTDLLQKNGFSSIKFMAETNPGEGFYLVKEIASGGELSRILLALRSVLSSKDSINIFLFDEIDTGIGGETAICVGKSLEKVAISSQVIAITHLPQIANFAEKLILVSKEIQDSRTVSLIKEKSGEELASEVENMGSLGL